MISVYRLRFIIASLLILALLVVWQYGWQTGESGAASDNRGQNRVDWFVYGGVHTRYDLEGTRRSVTDSPEVTHYESQQRSHLRKPYSVGLFPDQRVSHTLSAEEAYHWDDNSRILLEQQVELHHNPETAGAIAFYTPSLNYYPEQGLAITQDHVEIDADGAETQAVGMEFYTTERRIELLSQVRGNYVPAQSK